MKGLEAARRVAGAPCRVDGQEGRNRIPERRSPENPPRFQGDTGQTIAVHQNAILVQRADDGKSAQWPHATLGLRMSRPGVSRFDGLEPVVKETHLSRKPSRRGFFVALASVAVLLAASVVYWTDPEGLGALLPASRESVFANGEYWRLATSILVHADFRHFLSNVVVFALLAFLLYGYYGPWVYPGLAIGLGSLVTALSLRTYQGGTLLLGASGVVYLMAGFWLTLYLFVERRVGPGKRLMRAIGFGLIVLVPTAVEPQVSYRSHAIGFASGVAAALVYFSRHRERLRGEERVELE